jgi:hypothetical protein
LAKILIMLVRVLGLAAIVVGSLLWTTNNNPPYLGPHIGIGFCVTTVVFVMAVLAMTKGAIVPGVVGLLLAVLLPVAGFMQLPLHYHAMGGIQLVHVVIGLSMVGIAERLYSALRRPA